MRSANERCRSTAPALIYRDSDLIKRAIRDLYHREIDEVVVEGDEGYKAARGFMKLLMPSHVRRVKQHVDTTPLFQRFGVEDQLSAMYQPVVQLKSGGYLVINPTEALVSIDINSGRSTREHNIEQTAFATNLEAAAEIARQLRLRDMAGLVVIDFIDMEQNSHVRKVEKAMKEALKNDRARIQVGRISSFGLMEMSRQRLRTGVLEASTKPCPHCDGTGLMRTAASAGLSALRIIEDEATRGRGDQIVLRAGREAAVYVLNKKRAELADIEQRYGVSIEIVIDEGFEGARMTVESSGPRPTERRGSRLPPSRKKTSSRSSTRWPRTKKKTRKKRSRFHSRASRPKRATRAKAIARAASAAAVGEADADADAARGVTAMKLPKPMESLLRLRRTKRRSARPAPTADAEEGARPAKGRRRRGGRKAAEAEAEAPVEPDSSPMVERPTDEEPPIADTAPVEEVKPKRRRSKKAVVEAKVAVPEPAPAEAPPAETAEAAAEAPAKPARKRRTKKDEALLAEAAPAAERPVPAAANSDTAEEDSGEPRRGWWQRTFG